MNYSFAPRTKTFESSAVRDILAVIQQGNVISFAGGLPAEDIFPIEEVQIAYEKVFASGKGSLQYGATEGYSPLREAIQAKMERKGITINSDNILITTGSQQTIDLFSRIMLAPGDVVLTEDPSYLSALQVFRSYGAKVVDVKSDEQGMIPDDLHAKIKEHHPKFVYVIPTFSNPDGKAWSNERRQQLLNLCFEYDVLVLEDDPYGDIQFHEEEVYHPVASFDHEHTHVIYTSTFSKSVVPALRTGWAAGPKEVIQLMIQGKQMNDLHSSSIDQQALFYLLRDFNLDGHIKVIRSVYHERMKIMSEYLQQMEPGLFSWNEPKGGMFIWVKGQEHLHTAALLKEAVKKGVAFVPGEQFFVNEPKQNTMRLNFSHSTPEKIKLGMDRLVEVFKSVPAAL